MTFQNVINQNSFLKLKGCHALRYIHPNLLSSPNSQLEMCGQ